MNERSICVVEPHADDAFLSLGTHIEEWIKKGVEVTIWTVFSGTRNRASDAQAYAEAVKARWIGSGLVEGFGLDNHSEALGSTRAEVNSNQVILPIALTHSEHVSVRSEFERLKFWPDPEIFYYLDQPYAITQKNGDAVVHACAGKRIISYRMPGSRKFRHIPLFKDQAKFFHYNPAEKLIRGCELVLF